VIHSKAIDVLKTFTKEELKQFSDFLRSPFHNKNKNLIALFDTIKNYHPEYTVDNALIFTKLYPDKSFNINNIKKLMSEMMKLCERFLTIACMEKEQFVLNKTLLKELSRRSLDEYYKIVLKRTEAEFPEEYPEHYNNRSVIEGYKIEFSLTRNLKSDYIKLHNDKFSNDICYFLFQTLIYLQCMTAYKNSYNVNSENENLYKLITTVDYDFLIGNFDSDSNENKLIYMILNMLKLFANPKQETNFFNAKAMFYELFDKSIQEIRDDYTLYFTVLSSHCTRMMRSHNLKFCKEQFELCNHRFMVMQNTKNVVVATHWNDIANVIHISVYLNETEWAENFLDEIEKFTNVKDFDYIFNYSKACIEHRKGNPEKSLEYSSRIFLRDHELRVSVVIIKLSCYYDLELFETALSAVDSLSHQIYSSDKYNERYKSNLKCFADIYKKLLRLKEDTSKISEFDLNNVRKLLEEKEFTINDRWVLEKLKELEDIHNKSLKNMKLKHE